jgi:membrane-associated protein
MSRMVPPCATNGCKSPVTIEGFLIAYGGALILPLAVIEGPVVSIITGFLAARLYFPWYWAFALLVCGDLIGDLLYYWIGRTAGTPLAALGRRFGERFVPGRELQEDLSRNVNKMLFVGKWTHSVGFLVLIGSGMLRVPLARFAFVNLLATLPKSAVLFGIGFFAGGYYKLVEGHAVLAAIMLFVVGSLAILFIVRRATAIRARQ